MACRELETERLRLRQWRESDWPVFAEMSAHPEVMAYFPKLLQAKESRELAEKYQQLLVRQGWGLWAVALKEPDQFIGFVGLHAPSADLPFSPCLEIAWRLHRPFWGKGYATEAANQALAFAFESLSVGNVLSFTSCANQPSRRVMERLGMVNTDHNFKHPDLGPNHPLAEHVLYAISQEEWRKKLSTLANDKR